MFDVILNLWEDNLFKIRLNFKMNYHLLKEKQSTRRYRSTEDINTNGNLFSRKSFDDKEIFPFQFWFWLSNELLKRWSLSFRIKK